MRKYIKDIIENDLGDCKCNEQFCLGFQKGYIEGFKDTKPVWYNMAMVKPYDVIGWTKYDDGQPTYGETWNPDNTVNYFVGFDNLVATTPKFLVYNVTNGFFCIDYMRLFDDNDIVTGVWLLCKLEGLEQSENLWWTILPNIPIKEIESLKNKQFGKDDLDAAICEGSPKEIENNVENNK